MSPVSHFSDGYPAPDFFAIPECDFVNADPRAALALQFERLPHFQIDLLKKRTGDTGFKSVVDRRFIAKIKGMVGITKESVDDVLDHSRIGNDDLLGMHFQRETPNHNPAYEQESDP